MMRFRAPLGCALFVLLLCVPGCNTGPTMADVKGVVKVDDKPVSEGTIGFYPTDGKAPTTGCAIKDGAYSARVPVGKMQVRINVPVVVGEVEPYPNSPKRQVKGESLPKRYNAETTLEIDVKAGVNDKNWDLKSE